jgi:hypothetical protein
MSGYCCIYLTHASAVTSNEWQHQSLYAAYSITSPISPHPTIVPVAGRFWSPEVWLPFHYMPEPGKERHPSQVFLRVCESRGLSDAWSLLVTWKVILSGMGPWFWLPRGHEGEEALGEFLRACYDNHEVMEGVLEARYKPLLSPEALAFFKGVLVADWHKRPTPAQVLKHPYVKE